MASGASGGAASAKQKSKAYLSSVAIQSDAAKYRQKYKELKRKVQEIEWLQVMSLRSKRNIQRLRLERAILYERIEADMRHIPILADDSGAPMPIVHRGAEEDPPAPAADVDVDEANGSRTDAAHDAEISEELADMA
ncbi:hypothetical protein MSPP1_003717 [Malassezia sp. CBS 17886]|nr:hypothetical protein MSPP1_003717 [Malassezia sp. CBS 17886]